uniref:Adenylate kinase n=1 Tax=Globodera pallida TaxID=36090 RepID=A0A183CI41_GLOPA
MGPKLRMKHNKRASPRGCEPPPHSHLPAPSGDLLRNEVNSGSELGKQLKETMDAGGLVPLDKVLAIVKAAMLKECETSKGFLIDGYPREVIQGQQFEQEIQSPVLVIYFEASEATLVKRLMGRGRSDDNADTIKNRLRNFVESTKPVVEYYEKQGKLVKIVAESSVENIFAEVSKHLKERIKRSE